MFYMFTWTVNVKRFIEEMLYIALEVCETRDWESGKFS